MRSPLRVLLLAAVWVVLTRDPSLANAGLGLALGALLVRATRGGAASEGRAPGSRSPARLGAWRRVLLRPLLALDLAGFFLYELLISNLRIALLILRPRMDLRPMILSIPVDVRSEEELAVLSDLVTLTPGTLSLDVTDNGDSLLVHVLSARDPEGVRRSVQQGLGRRVRRLFA